jgi:hypothetical protein
MNLGRQDISATTPTQIIDVRFDADSRIFTCSTPSGFAVYRSYPLTLVRKRGTPHLTRLVRRMAAYERLLIFMPFHRNYRRYYFNRSSFTF